MLVELSVIEQRYQAVLGGRAGRMEGHEGRPTLRVSRQSVHAWISRYEAGGLGALADRSHRPRHARIRRTPRGRPASASWAVSIRHGDPADRASARTPWGGPGAVAIGHLPMPAPHGPIELRRRPKRRGEGTGRHRTRRTAEPGLCPRHDSLRLSDQSQSRCRPSSRS